jgi:hypothetical protein
MLMRLSAMGYTSLGTLDFEYVHRPLALASRIDN